MPDAHEGYGMPIGGILAVKDVVIPNAVGVDIGCGMCAIKTSLTELDIETLKKIMGEIRKAIPLGHNHHKKAQDRNLMPSITKLHFGLTDQQSEDLIITKEFSNALTQIGTLGGGNHFIEIQHGSDGHIWIMVHSGSRNFGLKIATHYNDIAKELNKKWKSEVPPSWDLAFLPLDSEEGQRYLDEMTYATKFAFANRKLMMDRITNIFINELMVKQGGSVRFDPMINIAHNYAAMENHFGDNVLIHRKGATLAREGTIGIIPGSQGTHSYIVKGLGNKESFESCSHGAGRQMSRSKAKETLILADEIKKLDDQGIVHGIRNIKDLDEASGAYKDIDIVMDNQRDLVETLVELQPLAVIKG
jgi:tRNA-splicing ligase RtcB